MNKVKKEKIKSIVTEIVLQFFNESGKPINKKLDVKGLGVQSGFDVPIKNLNKSKVKIAKPSTDNKLPPSPGSNVGMNEKFEAFLKEIKKDLE